MNFGNPVPLGPNNCPIIAAYMMGLPARMLHLL
jgi:hypothetical protein